MTRKVVSVHRASGWKCHRCSKVLPEVGLHPEHALCLRCVEVVTGEPADLYALASAAWDAAYRDARDAGREHAEAVVMAGAVVQSGPLGLPAWRAA